MRVRTAVVVGGLSEARQLRDVKAGAEVVIATPAVCATIWNDG